MPGTPPPKQESASPSRIENTVVAPVATAAAVGEMPGVTEAKLRALYADYLGAKKQCGEDVSRFTYEALARTIAKQVPELVAKYRAKSVDFRVEVKGGRAVLKVLPKV